MALRQPTMRYCKSHRHFFFFTSITLKQGVSNSFALGATLSLEVAFKGPNVILGLYECNYSLPGGKELNAAAW